MHRCAAPVSRPGLLALYIDSLSSFSPTAFALLARALVAHPPPPRILHGNGPCQTPAPFDLFWMLPCLKSLAVGMSASDGPASCQHSPESIAAAGRGDAQGHRIGCPCHFLPAWPTTRQVEEGASTAGPDGVQAVLPAWQDSMFTTCFHSHHLTLSQGSEISMYIGEPRPTPVWVWRYARTVLFSLT